MRKSGWHISLGVKLTIFLFLAVIVSVGSVGFFSYYRFYRITLETNQRIARMFAEVQAFNIDGDLYEATASGGVKDDFWYELKAKTDELKVCTDMAYISLLITSAPDVVVYFLDGEKPGDDPEMICDFLELDIPESFEPQLFDTMKTGLTTWSNNTYPAGRYGALIAGYAAITNSAGEIVGVVSCDVDAQDAVDAAAEFAAYLIAAGAAACVIFIACGLLFINLTVRKPLKTLSGASKRLTAGDFQINLNIRSSDELGQLAKNFLTLARTLNLLTEETNNMIAAHGSGELDYQIDSSQFSGSYMRVANGINDMSSEYVKEYKEIIHVMRAMGEGNFNVATRDMPGQKKMLSDAIAVMRGNLRRVNEELLCIVELARRGALNRRIDSERFDGGWRELSEGVNELLKSISVPIDEAASVLGDISAGKLDRRFEGEYEGDFNKIKTSVNNMCGNISVYIKELSTVLKNLESNRFDIRIEGDYVGHFVDLKDSVNGIVSYLHDVFGRLASELQTVSDSISRDSSSLASSGDVLANTSRAQSDAISDLLDDIHMINEHIAQMTDNAAAVNDLTSKARESASIGDDRMQSLLTAMNSISASSEKIMQVIQVIDDIAFQTNLLALNAAVEAAHAGRQGRGFAVVADHVRNLANRSKESAVESARLIEESMEEIHQGMSIALKTGDALKDIVDSVEQVYNRVEIISQSAIMQANAIQTVNAAVDIINASVANSSETTEEIAAIARELSDRSSEMNGLLLGWGK